MTQDTEEIIGADAFRPARRVSRTPFKVLDAPHLKDDFYLNLVDWSSTNLLAVGLRCSVYVYSAATGQVDLLCEVPDEDSITSINWHARGNYLAVGTASGNTQIWDV
jgi:cell division cycle 20-like protein 1 (cofactor of APC complex)